MSLMSLHSQIYPLFYMSIIPTSVQATRYDAELLYYQELTTKVSVQAEPQLCEHPCGPTS